MAQPIACSVADVLGQVPSYSIAWKHSKNGTSGFQAHDPRDFGRNAVESVDDRRRPEQRAEHHLEQVLGVAKEHLQHRDRQRQPADQREEDREIGRVQQQGGMPAAAEQREEREEDRERDEPERQPREVVRERDQQVRKAHLAQQHAAVDEPVAGPAGELHQQAPVHDAGDDVQRIARLAGRQDDREDDVVDDRRQQRVRERPREAEPRAHVADADLLDDEVADQVDVRERRRVRPARAERGGVRLHGRRPVSRRASIGTARGPRRRSRTGDASRRRW